MIGLMNDKSKLHFFDYENLINVSHFHNKV